MLVKKILIVLCIILTALGSVSACAETLTVPEELVSYGKTVYDEAWSYFGRSFSGYCGTYVSCQLRAMGIFDNQFDLRGNGNQWYSNFDNVTVTSGGYNVYRESGADCLTKLSDNYGNNLENIVLSFPIQSGYTASNPGAGHALVIYRLQDGIAYYSESFSFGNHPEGTVIAENAQDLVNRYSKRHGTPIGCVLLSKTESQTDSIGFVWDNRENALGNSTLKRYVGPCADVAVTDESFYSNRFVGISVADI